HIAPEGEVLGVIRLEFNLNHLTQMVNHRTLIGVGIMSVIALFGFMLTLFFMRRIIVLPLQKTSAFMCEVSKSKDLSHRLENDRKDELGQLAVSINSLMDTVSDSLQQVQDTSHSLADSAKKLTNVAQVTDQAANNQQKETAEVQTNITDMQGKQQQVEFATEEASKLVNHTTSIVQQSAKQAHAASEDI
ncbi:HAMP domain-containing protein, partial [Vibrio cholerae]|nr:HAMP domain-containing protein [Vibrio cholerae]